MNSRQLECFVEIVNKGGISDAARALYVSPSSLCQMVSKLEDEFGVLLFTHKRGSYGLTAAGKQLYEFAVSTMRNYQQLVRSINDSDSNPSGELSISMSVKRAASLLPVFLPVYMERYPKIKINAQADMLTVEEREWKLLDGKCDFIINSYHTQHTNCDLEYVNIGTEQMTLFLGRDTALARRLVTGGQAPDCVPFEAVLDEPLLLPPAIYGGRYMVDRMYSALGKKPRILAQVSPINASKSLVETGKFSTLSPEIIKNNTPLTPQGSRYYTIPVVMPREFSALARRPIYMIYKKDVPLVSFQRAFIELALALCGGACWGNGDGRPPEAGGEE